MRLKESSVLVIPLRMENMPQIILEAFYLKVPIIATAVGGVPELVTHEENGILILPEDPEVMILAINRLLREESLASTLAENGYRHAVATLTWDTMLPRYIRFYVSVHHS